jgi:hypothetical protein
LVVQFFHRIAPTIPTPEAPISLLMMDLSLSPASCDQSPLQVIFSNKGVDRLACGTGVIAALSAVDLPASQAGARLIITAEPSPARQTLSTGAAYRCYGDSIDLAPRVFHVRGTDVPRKNIGQSRRQLEVATCRLPAMCFSRQRGPVKATFSRSSLRRQPSQWFVLMVFFTRDCLRVTKHRAFEQGTGGLSGRANPEPSSCFHHSSGTHSARWQSEPSD